MIPLSDRQHDAFDNPAKMACRSGNLRVLREAAALLWQDGDRTRLRCDWCELMGETGWLTLDLLERDGVLAPSGFVGIDLDLARIDGFRQRRPDLKWVAANLYERLDAPELANVGILNLDEYGEVGNRCAQVDFPLIRGLVKRGLESFGEFALFWNQDLDAVARRRQDRGQALRRHADMVCDALRGCLPRRELTSAMLLPEGSEERINSGEVGVLGAFEVYRGSVRGHRMANLRIILCAENERSLCSNDGRGQPRAKPRKRMCRRQGRSLDYPLSAFHSLVLEWVGLLTLSRLFLGTVMKTTEIVETSQGQAVRLPDEFVCHCHGIHPSAGRGRHFGAPQTHWLAGSFFREHPH